MSLCSHCALYTLVVIEALLLQLNNLWIAQPKLFHQDIGALSALPLLLYYSLGDWTKLPMCIWCQNDIVLTLMRCHRHVPAVLMLIVPVLLFNWLFTSTQTISQLDYHVLFKMPTCQMQKAITFPGLDRRQLPPSLDHRRDISTPTPKTPKCLAKPPLSLNRMESKTTFLKSLAYDNQMDPSHCHSDIIQLVQRLVVNCCWNVTACGFT